MRRSPPAVSPFQAAVREAAGAVRSAGRRLGYVHLDDNDGRQDLHLGLTEGVLTKPSLKRTLDALREVEYQGPEMSIGSNGRYILDFLGVVESERIQVKVSDALSPALFEPLGEAGYTCVVMPMRA